MCSNPSTYSPSAFGSLMEDLSRQTGAAVIFPHFSPAPEKQYPSQFEESFAVLKYMVEHGNMHGLKTETMSFAGDSAGGKFPLFFSIILSWGGYLTYSNQGTWPSQWFTLLKETVFP